MTDLSLYIHIPWCLKICPYCDFNTYKLKKYDSKIRYIKHLIQDLKTHSNITKQRNIKTIFIGGGTPSLLNSNMLKYLLNTIKENISYNRTIEITIEVNPETVTIEKILDYIKCGINRFSFGVQTFNPTLLKLLGRTHSPEKTICLLYEIQKYNTINFNIDLMYGIPQQTLHNCLSDLETAILINPQHISWYQLSIEKNTIFYYQQPMLPTESKIWAMYKQGNSLLIQSKYQRYEISSYSRNHNICLHNMNYWKFGDYLGIGCGAHSKITKQNGDIIRITKKKRLYEYCHKSQKYTAEIIKIPDQEKPVEYFMNVCRLLQPIKKTDFKLYTRLKLHNIQNNIQHAVFKKYILEKDKYWYITQKGRDFLNDLIMLFI
ncbi:radical SAM family heme chaperone HemW [Buchnera aphidicola (Takecallis taiwana)]|uniref:radical SAM family heme chaperone HemW n=1 Tax=Buchnera aphidicola TaxID=9 RepID=UPI0031B6FF37